MEYRGGKAFFQEAHRQVTFHISPLSFYQVNPKQAERLYSLVRYDAKLTGKEIVWDLYCGVGTIGCFLAADAKEVYGVEVIPDAIRDARRNAEDNGIHNMTFHVGKAEAQQGVSVAFCKYYFVRISFINEIIPASTASLISA